MSNQGNSSFNDFLKKVQTRKAGKPTAKAKFNASSSLKEFLSASTNPNVESVVARELENRIPKILSVQVPMIMKECMPKIVKDAVQSVLPGILAKEFNGYKTPSPNRTSHITTPRRNTRSTPTGETSRQSTGLRTNRPIIPDMIIDDSGDDAMDDDTNDVPANVLEYLFNANMNQGVIVVNFGDSKMTRADIQCLRPKTPLSAPVLDCVASVCRLAPKEFESPFYYWYLSPYFADAVCKGTCGDEEIMEKFGTQLQGLNEVAEDNNKYKSVYIPIMDKKHCFLAIMEYEILNVTIFDTSHTMKDTRKDMVSQVVIKLCELLGKPEKGKLFSYQCPSWVPLQKNAFESGLFVCMKMKFVRDEMIEIKEDVSEEMRTQLAWELYGHPSNTARFIK